MSLTLEKYLHLVRRYLGGLTLNSDYRQITIYICLTRAIAYFIRLLRPLADVESTDGIMAKYSIPTAVT